MVAETEGEARLTTDRETIERWADEHDIVPVRITGADGADDTENPYRLHADAERTEEMERLSWDEFYRQVEEGELVVLSRETEEGRTFEVVDRSRAVNRASMADSEIEERLMAGETITSEVTETTVIERTIVEHLTIESEVVDTEVLDSRIVDVDLLRRQIGGCDVGDREVLDEVDRSRFEDVDGLAAGGRHEELPRPMGVQVDVDERWLVTRELLERATIESRIVDTDVSETEEVESADVEIESAIDLESVQRNLLESDIVETEADAGEVIESEVLESEFHEDNVVRTQLTQRRVVEDEIGEEKTVRGELTDVEVDRAETTSSTSVETAFVDSTDLDADVAFVGVTEYESAAAEARERAEEPGSSTSGDGGTVERETAAEAAVSDSSDTPGASGSNRNGDTDVRVSPTENDVGKRVVDARGRAVGMIEKVRGGTAYVDPDPGIVDRIKASLKWGDAADDAYPLETDQIERITDDAIELSIPK